MHKRDLRKQFLQKRLELSPGAVAVMNDKIAGFFMELIDRHPSMKTVHIFLPIASMGEVDTWPVIHRLWQKGLRVAVPVADHEKIALSSWLLTPQTKLHEGRWGVPEPEKSVRIHDNEIDMVVLPLLAFDRRGYRVGYGKGYYDNFLRLLHHDPLKAGLSFWPPVEKIDDVHEKDVKMDYCITPEGIISF